MWYLIISIVIIAMVLFTLIKDEKSQKEEKIAALFLGRQPLSSQDFYEKYYQNIGIPFEIIEKTRKILENVLETDLSCLSASDDFSKNLSFFWDFDSMADVELILSLEEEFNIKGSRLAGTIFL